MQRWKCPIHNETFIWTILWKISSVFGLKGVISDNSYIVYCSINALVTFVKKQLKISFQNIRFSLYQTKLSNGTLVNRTLQSLPGGSLDIPLSPFKSRREFLKRGGHNKNIKIQKNHNFYTFSRCNYSSLVLLYVQRPAVT